MSSYIQARRLKKIYGHNQSTFTAVNEMSFEIEQGEFVTIMGESGSGKSTLLSMMGGLNTPTSGKYRVDDIDLYALGQDQQAEFRREFLGFVFQNFYLIPYLSVLENVMVPLVTSKKKTDEKRDMAEHALTQVGLIGKEGNLPNEISGGEQERVAIARAVVNEPAILLADEPTGNLDRRNSQAVMDLFRSLNGTGMTIIMVTHSHECARNAGRVINVSDGRLVNESRLGER